MFRILDCKLDADEWDDAFASLSSDCRDVHFTSAYARTQLLDGFGGRAICIVSFTGEYGLTMQPFRMSPIGNSPYWDLKSLYGFGGPVGLPSINFHLDLEAWAIEHGVVSEFCVLHPLLFANQLPIVASAALNVQWIKDTVVVEDLKTYGPHRTRRRVKRGMEKICGDNPNPVLIILDREPRTFDLLYRLSMERLNAEDRWRFPLEYWQQHFEEPALHARIVLLIDRNDPYMPRRGLFTIGYGSTAYAHFLGSDGERRNDGLDELLYNITIYNLGNNEEFERRFERMHLGGGLTSAASDPLLMFKKGFSQTTYRVGTYQRVFMPEVYRDLCAIKSHNEKIEHGRVSDHKWFPEYRRKFI